MGFNKRKMEDARVVSQFESPGGGDFQKNSEGKWTSSPNTRIGKIDFSSHAFGTGEVDIGGVDLAAALDQKCAAK